MTPYYQDSLVTIYHGDCREIVPQLPSPVTLVLTDPPYGIGRDKGFCGRTGFRGIGAPIARKRFPTDTWDTQRPEAALFALLLQRSKHAIFWGGNFFADFLPQSTHWIVWDKQQTMPSFGDCELAWTNFPRQSVQKVTIEWNGLLGKERGSRDHPTQKPLDLMRWCLLSYAKPGDCILDPFLGAGTTLRAAKDLGLRAIGIEVDRRYCEISRNRLAQESFNFCPLGLAPLPVPDTLPLFAVRAGPIAPANVSG